MKGDETRKTKQNNKIAILEKLKESIMSKEINSKVVVDLPRNVENPDDTAELIERIEHIMKSKKKTTFLYWLTIKL